MKKNEQQMTYETPEAEEIELRMEASILSGCPSGDTEGGYRPCPEDSSF